MTTYFVHSSDEYENLVLAYATGQLKGALAVALATHLQLNESARQKARAYEALGGALLENHCGQTELSEDCLEKMLGKIDKISVSQKKTEKPLSDAYEDFFKSLSLPHMLENYIIHTLKVSASQLKWMEREDGGYICTLRKQSKVNQGVRLLRFYPGKQQSFKIISEKKRLAVVLDGGIVKSGTIYRRGDIAVLYPDEIVRPDTENRLGTLCLIVDN
ncbi:MAG: hypothetical protein CL565_03905 [Alphaproteobacteria bacterium]|nr:hypothetical protein [Alphaproteobacteria bacterium]